jgi:hypothetical protein
VTLDELLKLLKAGASGAVGGAMGFPMDTAVGATNLSRAAYGYGGHKMGLLSAAEMPQPIEPKNVPGTSAHLSGLLGVGDSPKEQIAEMLGGLLAPGPKTVKQPNRSSMAKGIPKSVKSAAVQVGDKTYLGFNHGDAANKAVYDGALRRQNGRLVPTDPQHKLNFDLFLTDDGQLIDRLTAYRLFDVGAAETAIEKGMVKPQPARRFEGDGSLGGQLSNLLYGP